MHSLIPHRYIVRSNKAIVQFISMSDNFAIQIPKEVDYPAIHDFIFDDFFPRERLNVASGLSKERTKDDSRSRERFENWLRDGVSLIALDSKTQQLAGICINYRAKKEDNDQVHFKYPSRSMEALMTFVEKLEKNFDVFGSSKVDQGLDLCFLCVKEEFTGQGLGRKLIQKTIELAQSLKLGFIQSIPTAPATIHLFEDLSFETKAEMKLKEYFLSDELPGFPFALENDFARYVVKFL